MTPFAGTYSSGNALNDQEFAHIVMGIALETFRGASRQPTSCRRI